MPRSKTAKVRVSVTVDPKLLSWVHARVGPGKPFGTVSHAFESGIVRLTEAELRQK
jgi:hypothetical protein